ncbi:MAG: degU 2, partial [Prosthecobacter sp.]|nr:degU 2 [Prosthecobacter sp.]
GEAEDGQQAVMLAKQLRPDVVLMDITMPRLSGLEATQRILRNPPSPKILVLSANTEAAYVQRLKALGASGYVLKSASYHLLPDTIRKVHQGNDFFGPERALRA